MIPKELSKEQKQILDLIFIQLKKLGFAQIMNGS